MNKTIRAFMFSNVLVALALAALVPMKVRADKVLNLDYIQTTVYDSQDMDTAREGIQLMYEWRIRNQDPPAGDYTEDALWKVTIGADLAQRGMYGFSNNNYDNNFDLPSFTKWSSGEDNGNYSWVANLPGNEPIRGNDLHYFRALIDADRIIGQEQVGIQGFANSGATQIAQINVPVAIPEPMTIGLLASGAGVLLAGRKVMRNSKRR